MRVILNCTRYPQHSEIKLDLTEPEELSGDPSGMTAAQITNYREHLAAMEEASDSSGLTLVHEDGVSLRSDWQDHVRRVEKEAFDVLLCGDHDPTAFYGTLRGPILLDFKPPHHDITLHSGLKIRCPSFSSTCIVYSSAGAQKALEQLGAMRMPFCYQICCVDAHRHLDVLHMDSIVAGDAGAELRMQCPEPPRFHLAEDIQRSFVVKYIGFEQHLQHRMLEQEFDAVRFNAKRPLKGQYDQLFSYGKWLAYSCGERHTHVHFFTAGALGLLDTSRQLWLECAAADTPYVVMEGNVNVVSAPEIKECMQIFVQAGIDFLLLPSASFNVKCRPLSADDAPGPVAVTSNGTVRCLHGKLGMGTKCYIISPRFAEHMAKTCGSFLPNVHIDAMLCMEACYPSGVTVPFRGCYFSGTAISVKGKHYINHTQPVRELIPMTPSDAVCHIPLIRRLLCRHHDMGP